MKRIKVTSYRINALLLLLGISLSVLSLTLIRPRGVRAAAITVTTTANSGSGSLRDAIANASSGDTINFSLPAGSMITLTSGELLIDKNLTISGPGASLLTVQRSTAGGTPQFGIFHIAGNFFNVTISGLTISNGNTTGNGGGLLSESSGTVSVTNCTVSGNSASFGGGLLNSAGTMNVSGCTISSNSAGERGGGIVGNILNLDNSIISGNSAGTIGGGIFSSGAL